ncbi:MAG TPA: glutamyl-tRNA reductase [Terriglobia bacterium]|nr:glutamyl-tRNA reductase [Terriglobia bacterium]
MNLILVGISHHSAPVEVRERMNIHESRLQAALTDLMARDGIREALILSTCNRVDLAASGEEGSEAEAMLRQFLADYHRYDPTVYDQHLYWYRDADVIRHLFRVACSLDSMIVGEPQILGQFKQAYLAAREAGALTGVLRDVSEQALAAGRRVRRETELGSSAVSVSYAAVELARKIFGTLEGKTIFILGAGKMSELAARHLISSGANSILVANRTFARAEELAGAFGGAAVPFEDVLTHLQRADIVISSTGSPGFIVTRAAAEQLLAGRKQRPMFFVDIAVPRDIDPVVNQLNNAFVYDIDDLQQVVKENLTERQREAVRAEKIVEEEVERTLRRLASRELAPTIVAIERRLEGIRQAEIERYRSRLGDLTPEQRQSIEALTRGMLNKILHGPITEMKSRAGGPEHSALVNLVRRMFGVNE